MRPGLAAAAALALSACAAAPQPPAPAPTLGLVGTGWSLTTLDGQPAAAPVSLRFEVERVVGQGPCNRFRGGFTEGPGDALEIGPVAATKAACPALAFEDSVIGALTDSMRGARSGETLTIYGRDGAALMTLTGG